MSISTSVAPRSFSTLQARRATPPSPPRRRRISGRRGRGMPITGCGGARRRARPSAIGREKGSRRVVAGHRPRRRPRHRRRCRRRPRRSRACGRPAPRRVVETAPTDGLSPTMLLRPPARGPSPPCRCRARSGTSPRATATAEPELEPPGTIVGIEWRCAAPDRACARRRGRWRTGRGWSCRSRIAPAATQRARPRWRSRSGV